MSETPQDALVRLADGQGTSLAALSRMLDRNAAYLQQYVRRGSPRVLPERERGLLARFFGVDEGVLGRAGHTSEEVAVPYLDVAAAAGAGRIVENERARRYESFARAALAGVGVRPQDASVIDVVGDSMAPTLLHGDRVLVDRAATRIPPRGGVFVVRVEDALLVKRTASVAGLVRLGSDNPDHPTRDLPAGEVTVIGRARLLLRTL